MKFKCLRKRRNDDVLALPFQLLATSLNGN